MARTKVVLHKCKSLVSSNKNDSNLPYTLLSWRFESNLANKIHPNAMKNPMEKTLKS